METIYIEKSIQSHPRVLQILKKFRGVKHIIDCEHYGEVFNPKAQNFRAQKQKPALILAKKTGRLVLPTPEGFGIGGIQNYYFSHMLNCLYDCRYCFLQGMYPSANYVLFINYEDFMDEIKTHIPTDSANKAYFFSGYDGDSLAFDPVSSFLDAFLPFFREQTNAILELRTKSANYKTLLEHEALENCVVAFSFTPEQISSAVEHKVPPVQKRIAAMQKIAERGWKIGLRFDPLIYSNNFEKQYAELLQQIFKAVSANCIHSVSIGPMRFPAKMFQRLVKLYPEDKLLAHPLYKRDNYFSYKKDLEMNMKNCVITVLQQHLPRTVIFECSPL